MESHPLEGKIVDVTWREYESCFWTRFQVHKVIPPLIKLMEIQTEERSPCIHKGLLWVNISAIECMEEVTGEEGK